MPQERKTPDSKRPGADDREQRLAAALRENLRKRKAQQRGRGESGDAAAVGTAKPGDRGGRD